MSLGTQNTHRQHLSHSTSVLRYKCQEAVEAAEAGGVWVHFAPSPLDLQKAERLVCHNRSHQIYIKTEMEHNSVLSCNYDVNTIWPLQQKNMVPVYGLFNSHTCSEKQWVWFQKPLYSASTNQMVESEWLCFMELQWSRLLWTNSIRAVCTGHLWCVSGKENTISRQVEENRTMLTSQMCSQDSPEESVSVRITLTAGDRNCWTGVLPFASLDTIQSQVFTCRLSRYI